MMYDEKRIDDEFYEQILLKLYQDLVNIDQLFIMVADPKVIILRDYINQIYLEDRKKTTIEKVTQLRAGLENLLPLIENKMPNENLVKLDTSNIGEIETSIFIADKMLDGIHDKILCKNKH